MYQRNASLPYFAIASKGSMEFPRRFDIFWPFLSSTNPFETTVL